MKPINLNLQLKFKLKLKFKKFSTFQCVCVWVSSGERGGQRHQISWGWAYELPNMGAGSGTEGLCEADCALDLWAVSPAIAPGFISKVSNTIKT